MERGKWEIIHKLKGRGGRFPASRAWSVSRCSRTGYFLGSNCFEFRPLSNMGSVLGSRKCVSFFTGIMKAQTGLGYVHSILNPTNGRSSFLSPSVHSKKVEVGRAQNCERRVRHGPLLAQSWNFRMSRISWACFQSRALRTPSILRPQSIAIGCRNNRL